MMIRHLQSESVADIILRSYFNIGMRCEAHFVCGPLAAAQPPVEVVPCVGARLLLVADPDYDTLTPTHPDTRLTSVRLVIDPDW